MKINPGFVLRTICGQHVISGEGRNNVNFSKLISLNDTASYLFEKLKGKEDFTVEDMVSLLTEEYEVGEDTARADCEALVAKWREVGIIA